MSKNSPREKFHPVEMSPQVYAANLYRQLSLIRHSSRHLLDHFHPKESSE